MIGGRAMSKEKNKAQFGKRPYLPSPDEIEKMCKSFQRNWSKAAEQSKLRADWRQNRTQRVEIKTIREAKNVEDSI